jgi:hypothetical protein
MSDCYWEANIHCLFTCTVVLSHYFRFNLFTLANLISTSDDTLTAMMIDVEQHSGSKYLHVQMVRFSDTFTYVMTQDVKVKLNPGLPCYKAAFNKNNTSKVLHLEHICAWCWNLETCTSQLRLKFWNLLLGRMENISWTDRVKWSAANSLGGQECHKTINRRKANLIGHTLRRNCFSNTLLMER